MRPISLRSPVILAFCLVVLAALLPLWSGPGIVFIAGVALTETLFALSWNVLFGFTGLGSFGHAAFYALGAYLVGYGLLSWPEVPFPVLLLGVAILGAIVAAIVGYTALRRTAGIHLAVLTLALSEILRVGISHMDALGRDDGLPGIPRPLINLGIVILDLRSGIAYYYFLFFSFLVLTGVMWWLCNNNFGRVLAGIRQDPDRMAFLGVNVFRYRNLAFITSGAIAALAGGLAAPWTQILTPDIGHWLHSTQPMLNTLLGGVTSFWGPIFGTVIFSLITYGTRAMSNSSEIVIGGILLAVILTAPDGIAGFLSKLERRIRLRGLGAVAQPDSFAERPHRDKTPPP